MRRKNWINKKNHFYGNKNIFNSFFFNIFLNKNEFKFDEYNTKGQLYKVFLKKNKHSILTPDLNYYFYSDFFKIIKKKSKNIIYNNYIKNINKNILILLPSYTFKSQFFNNKFIFDDILIKFKLRGLFFYKNFYNNFYSSNSNFYKKHLIGYNYYILKSNFDKYLNIYKLIDDKEYNSVGKVKLFIDSLLINKADTIKDLNFFFFFNVFILKLLEIYKIIIYLYINILWFYKY